MHEADCNFVSGCRVVTLESPVCTRCMDVVRGEARRSKELIDVVTETYPPSPWGGSKSKPRQVEGSRAREGEPESERPLGRSDGVVDLLDLHSGIRASERAHVGESNKAVI